RINERFMEIECTTNPRLGSSRQSSTVDLRFLFSGFCYLIPLVQLVKVHHVDSQTELGCGLRVSGRKLLEVMIEEEVEGIFRIAINPNHVSIVHRELAKTKRCPAIRHKIACADSMS